MEYYKSLDCVVKNNFVSVISLTNCQKEFGLVRKIYSLYKI